MNHLLSELQQLNDSPTLPTHDDLLALTDMSLSVLENESAAYRPRSKKSAGGLLDFTAQEKLPLIVVPDLHARCDFFLRMLALSLGAGLTVCDALSQGRVRVVCLGDLFHSEKRHKERWLRAWQCYLAGDYESDEMTAEMQENLTLFQMVLRVKNAFPAYFHFLKGNHENILNEMGRGNVPFRKFAEEGAMVYQFMDSHYGDAVLHVLSLWEHALPVCAVFPNCAVSHAEPRAAYTKKQVIAYHDYPAVVLGLTWTANDEAEPQSVKKNLRALLGAERAESAVWFSGHRHTTGRYALRQQGKLVQLHNQQLMQVALVQPEKSFDPETDIISLDTPAENTCVFV